VRKLSAALKFSGQEMSGNKPSPADKQRTFATDGGSSEGFRTKRDEKKQYKAGNLEMTFS
jgi:hypothetical protein